MGKCNPRSSNGNGVAHYEKACTCSSGNAVRKMVSAIDVRIDDAGSILKFRIGFSSQLRPSLVIGFGCIQAVDAEIPHCVPIVDRGTIAAPVSDCRGWGYNVNKGGHNLLKFPPRGGFKIYPPPLPLKNAFWPKNGGGGGGGIQFLTG